MIEVQTSFGWVPSISFVNLDHDNKGEEHDQNTNYTTSINIIDLEEKHFEDEYRDDPQYTRPE